MKRVAFHTLGCKVNQYETNAMAALFQKSGYEIVDFAEPADVYIVNTCTITSISDKKSRQMIRRALRLNPEAAVVAVGCYSQIAPEEVGKIPGISLILGTGERGRIVSFVEEFLKEKHTLYKVSEITPKAEFEIFEPEDFQERTRAYIKIEDGCDRYCSYCIIPYARGPVRSRPLESVTAEARRLAGQGYKEVVLTGIHVASYGRDLGLSLLDAVSAVHGVEGIERIRLSSIDPTAFTDEFVEKIAALNKVCPHFHISLQSGCDKTLAAMRRRYTTADFEAVLARLRAALPDVAVTTDIIAGFPGETEEDHAKSCEFIRKAGFLNVHVFPYSERPGTLAAKMEGKVPKAVRERRAAEIIKIARESHAEFSGRFIGKEETVLFETEDNGVFEGYTKNYIRVNAPCNRDIRGAILPVRLIESMGDAMRGEIME